MDWLRRFAAAADRRSPLSWLERAVVCAVAVGMFATETGPVVVTALLCVLAGLLAAGCLLQGWRTFGRRRAEQVGWPKVLIGRR